VRRGRVVSGLFVVLKLYEELGGVGMRRALITGISGQDGSYLAELLRDR
jgi:hypothetical protein